MRIGLEYLKYRRRLIGHNLGQYKFSGPQANDHVRRVIERPLERPLKIFGFWKHSSWENYNLLPALQNVGEVTHYDPHPDYDPYTPGPINWTGKRTMQDKLWQMVTAGQPWDVMFFYGSGAFLDPAFVERLQSLGVPMVNFSHDDIVFFQDQQVGGFYRGTADIVRFFSLYCCTSVMGFHKALAVGATPYYLPGGANPHIYRSLPNLERDLDVVFIGARFYDRDEVIDWLLRQGVNVHVYGYGWPNGSVTNQQQIELLNRAKIVLGFNRYSSSDWLGIKGRDHEVPMTGAFHLVNDFPELRHIYAPGVEVGTYKNRRDLLAKIRYYLAHPDERQRIAAAGQRRAATEHSWQARFTGLFTRMGFIDQGKKMTIDAAVEARQ